MSGDSERITGKSEVMQTAEAAVFGRMPSGQDSPKTPALATHSSGALNAPPAASQTSVPGAPVKTNHALMAEPSASEPHRKLFHLTY